MSIQQAINHMAGNQERVGTPVNSFTDLMIDDSEGITARRITAGKKNLENALNDFENAKRTLLTASDALHHQFEGQSKRAKEAVSRAKDSAAQMTDAMNKISKLLGPDFDKRLDQLERLTSCMERLSELNGTGKLTGVLDALRK